MWLLVLNALWLILPAYTANAFPPLVHGKHPLDFGKKLRNHRILGNGKTIEGTVSGIAFGTFVGVLQMFLQDYVPLSLSHLTPGMVVLLSTGAIIGDIVGSFFKRRLGIERGKPALIIDQLDFLLGSLFFLYFVYTPTTLTVLVLLVLTPVLHRLANIIAFVFRIKKEPW
jgi:CDP-2,3-bis-(O-geranylgeranyl)-sn-glycerol synthase